MFVRLGLEIEGFAGKQGTMGGGGAAVEGGLEPLTEAWAGYGALREMDAPKASTVWRTRSVGVEVVGPFFDY